MSSVGSFFSYVNDARSHEPEVYESVFPLANSSEVEIHVAATCSVVTLSFLV